MNRYPCDLHCHTTRSDGADTPQELISNAAKLGLKVVAITDHDVTPPLTLLTDDGRELDACEFARERGVTLVPGIEFSTNTHVNDVHICGYRMDWTHPDLLAAEHEAVMSKVSGYHELTRRLTARGMPVDWEKDILLYGARPEETVQRKMIFETMAAKGYFATWAEAKIAVQSDHELNVQREKFDPAATIDLIHRCGGTAVLAHPHLIDEEVRMPGRAPLTREMYIDALIEAGLDGIEARYTYDKTSYKGSRTPAEIEHLVRTHTQGRLPVISGGSDYHADHKKGVANPRQLGDKGLTLAEFEAIRSYLLPTRAG